MGKLIPWVRNNDLIFKGRVLILSYTPYGWFSAYPDAQEMETPTVDGVGPDSLVGMATGYGLDGPGSNCCGEIFRTCPDRPLGPPSLL